MCRLIVLFQVGTGTGRCTRKCEDNPVNRTGAMGCLPDISKMAETNQPVPLLIAEPEGEGFVPGEKRDGRHGLRQPLRLVAPLPIVIGNLRAKW
jgi:hypothetical protein